MTVARTPAARLPLSAEMSVAPSRQRASDRARRPGLDVRCDRRRVRPPNDRPWQRNRFWR